MNPLTQNPRQSPGRFRVGDRVRMLYQFPGVVAEIIEDRGNIGRGGRRFYTIRFQPDQWNEVTVDYPEAELELVTPADASP